MEEFLTTEHYFVIRSGYYFEVFLKSDIMTKKNPEIIAMCDIEDFPTLVNFESILEEYPNELYDIENYFKEYFGDIEE